MKLIRVIFGNMFLKRVGFLDSIYLHEIFQIYLSGYCSKRET